MITLAKKSLKKNCISSHNNNIEILDILVTKAYQRLKKVSMNGQIGKREARRVICYFFHLDKKEFKILIDHMIELGLVRPVGNFSYEIMDI